MVSSKESFYSLDLIDGPSIHMGDDSEIPNVGKGTLQFDNGVFNSVVYAPSLKTCYLFKG